MTTCPLTSPRARGEVGRHRRWRPGEGAHRSAATPPHPNPLPAHGERERAATLYRHSCHDLRIGFLAALTIVASITLAFASPALAQSPLLDVRLLAINDFHGNLQPPPGGLSLPDPADPSKRISVRAGGAEHMATLVAQLRAGHANTAFVAAGDLIGASPFLSAMFNDEPTVESLSLMGLEFAAVGNHEFDQGLAELLRMQFGGCRADGCRGPHRFMGAGYRYLAASTIHARSGAPVLPPYAIKTFEGIPVAFIGLTLKNTPNLVSPAGVAGLVFRDEAETVNALVPELKARGVEAIVVLIHEGGFPSGGVNECPGISGPIVDIVKKFDRAVDVVVSGHTHQAYTCEIDGRLVTSGDKYGTLVTTIDLQIDRNTRDIVSAKADNVIVRSDALAADPAQTALITSYNDVAGPIANRPAGTITATLSRVPNEAGESALGDIVADAQLAATRETESGGAVIAFTNPGGVRTDLVMKAEGAVTFGDVFASQPFRNQLVTMTLTGAQIKAALEQQWIDPKRPRMLQVSRGFAYTWDNTKPDGARIVADSLMLNGAPIDPATPYRVTVNSFLAAGGDGFSVLKTGIDPRTGVFDVEALFDYVKANSPIAPGPQDRIRRMN